MGRPRFLVDNVFNPRIYPDHTLSASSTATGTSVLMLGSGRRNRALTGWWAETLNTEAYVSAACDRVRGVDMLWIDRDHNLAGESVSIRFSDDSHTTYTEVGPLTVPSAPTPHARLGAGQIVMADDGSLLWYLGQVYASYEPRVYVAAMGTGLRPEMSGLMLGLSWAPEHAPQKPFDFARPRTIRPGIRTAHVQAAGAQHGHYRAGSMHLQAASWDEYTLSLYSMEDLYLSGHGMVVVHDDTRAERAVFSMAPDGTAGWQVPSGKYFPEYDVPIEETEPRA